MVKSWSEHVGQWYAKNKGKNGINSLGDAMSSPNCKDEWAIYKNNKVNITMNKKNNKKEKKRTLKRKQKIQKYIRGGKKTNKNNVYKKEGNSEICMKVIQNDNQSGYNVNVVNCDNQCSNSPINNQSISESIIENNNFLIKKITKSLGSINTLIINLNAETALLKTKNETTNLNLNQTPYQEIISKIENSEIKEDITKFISEINNKDHPLQKNLEKISSLLNTENSGRENSIGNLIINNSKGKLFSLKSTKKTGTTIDPDRVELLQEELEYEKTKFETLIKDTKKSVNMNVSTSITNENTSSITSNIEQSGIINTKTQNQISENVENNQQQDTNIKKKENVESDEEDYEDDFEDPEED